MIAFLFLIASYFLDFGSTLILICFFTIAKFASYMRRHKLELTYDKSNKLFSEFVDKSNISTMEYETFPMAPTPPFQALCYLVKEALYENFYPDPFTRENVTCPDGGTIGLDWDGEIPDATQPLT